MAKQVAALVRSRESAQLNRSSDPCLPAHAIRQDAPQGEERRRPLAPLLPLALAPLPPEAAAAGSGAGSIVPWARPVART